MGDKLNLFGHIKNGGKCVGFLAITMVCLSLNTHNEAPRKTFPTNISKKGVQGMDGVLQWSKSLSKTKIKLVEKNKHATHSVKRCLKMCKKKQKTSVYEEIRKKILLVMQKSLTSDIVLGTNFASGLSLSSGEKTSIH